MKIWFDILTPKHTLFFEPLYRELSRDGHSLLITTRRYREAVEALQLRKLPFRIVGAHGGGTKIGKLLAGGARVVKLARIIDEWKPNTAISVSSPEAARVAFGLGVPHVAANDSPHSWRVARLSVPLSDYICSPWIFPRRVWLAYGAPSHGVISYKALDAAVWLKRHKPNPTVLKKLSLKKDKPIILLRTEESFASYLEGKSSDDKPVIAPVVRELLKLRLGAQIVISTRYGRQALVLRQEFGDKARVVDHIVDSTSLLYYSTAFIGSGGTMTVEAALLGRPTISCYPGDKPQYIKYLENQGVVKTILSPKRIASTISHVLSSNQELDEQQRRGKALLKRMEDPINVVSSVVRRTWKEPRN